MDRRCGYASGFGLASGFGDRNRVLALGFGMASWFDVVIGVKVWLGVMVRSMGLPWRRLGVGV